MPLRIPRKLRSIKNTTVFWGKKRSPVQPVAGLDEEKWLGIRYFLDEGEVVV